MASSQVEIASSPSPFGCILRDHNQRDLCRESKWRQFLAKDRINPIISIPSDHHHNRDEIENSWLPNNLQLKTMNQSHSIKKPKPEKKSASLCRSESLGEAPNLGASSLVQIWENRLNRSNSIKNLNSSSDSASRSNSGLSSNNSSETGESVLGDERFDSSGQSSPCRSRGSDVAESERVRVVDIIKRLAAANQDDQGGSSPPSDQTEQRIFSQALISPRIRGRQAFADLLMQMEKERHRELTTLTNRRAVSRFPQRGRIQSMLRLRSLQRGIVVQDRHRLRISSPPQAERLPQASSSCITHLRERFSTKAENGVTSRSGDSENPTSPCNEKPMNTEEEEKQNLGAILIEKQDKTILIDHSSRAIEDAPKEPFPSSTCQETSSGGTKLDSQETISEDRNLGSQETRSEDRNLGSQEKSSGEVRNSDDPLEAVGTADTVTSCDGWDENDVAEESEDNYPQYEEETNYDWINGISRPRSYWEDRRLEWYHEMLNSDSKNAEIRQLLERGTVSGFLASEFRERMDRLMEARLGRQNIHSVSHQVEEDEKTQLISFTQQQQQQHQHQQSDREMVEEEDDEQQQDEEEEEEEDEEEGEEESLISGQYNEANHYFVQTTLSPQIPLPTLLRSWSFHDNEEVCGDSDRAVSTSPPRDFPSQSYQNDRQHSSSVHHPSIEIELICELRGQMKQLYHEMSDLRKTLKSCIGIQMVLLQQSMKQEVHSASEEAKNRSYNEEMPKKGNCCICYERKIDSLLYRCGHMCTCVKCAHELQWNSGKCPKCCAPIVDVVRAYFDSYN